MPILDYAMRRAIAAQLQSRLSSHPDLRTRLLRDPKSVIATEFDVQIPEEVQVTVVENSAGHQYLSLPAPSESETFEAQSDANEEFETLLRQRAAQDDAFRRQALTDPKGALEALLHFKLPAQMTITIVEETPQTWYLVCPPLTALLVDELDDQALEAVAGGASSSSTVAPSTRIPVKAFTPSFHRPRYPVCH